MGAEKHGSKSAASYVGGLLQLFDWNAKSRKKLFLSKSSVPEQSKQKKRCEGNLPRTRFHLIDEDQFVTGSSIKGSSDYSCASSVTDEDIGGIRAPGVVARLMGLDSMPTSKFAEPYATPYFYSQSLQDSNYHSKNLGGHCECQIIQSGNLRNNMEAPVGSSLVPKHPKPLSRPIEKFQTEVLPPKSAKSIPITHHKLLSPIKSSNFVPSESAAHIMEAAARIIGPGPQAATKVKMPVVGSSSVPLKVRDLKEKVEASQKPSKLGEMSQRRAEANALKHLKVHSQDKSWNGSADTISSISSMVSSDLEECSSTAKSKGKSISLALQAKVNVQKREGLNSNSSTSLGGQTEPTEVISSELFKSQASTQKSTQKKPSTLAGSKVLRKNNQKQNCIADRGKLLSKPSASNLQGRKAHNGDSSSARHKSSSKNASNSKVVSRRLNEEVVDGKREDSSSNTRNITCKKRSIDGNFQFEKNRTPDNNVIGKNGKLIESSRLTEKQNSFSEATKRKGTDVISFTFTAPMTRSFVHGPETFREVSDRNDALSADYLGKTSLQTSSVMDKKFSFFGSNVIRGDALSTLLELKLRELTHAVESSHHKAETGGTSPSIFQDSVTDLDALSTTKSLHDDRSRDGMNTDDIVDKCNSCFSTDLQGFIMKHRSQVMDQATDSDRRNNVDARKLLDHRLPSPVSVLGRSIFTESCNSSDTADSINTGSKQSSSVLAQEVLGISCLKKPHLVDTETELSDSASSISTVSVNEKQVITSSMTELADSAKWELEYVKEILFSIELMFKDFALGRAHEIINHHLFDQLESQKQVLNKDEPKLSRKVLFDCVTEWLEVRFRRYIGGGCSTWIKGLSLVRSKGRLAEEVYKEISGLNDLGDCMVDELVDKDMSSKHGRWLDFDIEAFELGVQIESRILNLLLDEVIEDILVL